MLDILNLALPFFGLIFIGFACGKLRQIPDAGLAWMNFFILYVVAAGLVLPHPVEDAVRAAGADRLRQGHDGGDRRCLLPVVHHRPDYSRGRIAEATLAGVAGGFGNVGYMGPGLALATLGPDAAAPVALIFCFDALLIFALSRC